MKKEIFFMFCMCFTFLLSQCSSSARNHIPSPQEVMDEAVSKCLLRYLNETNEYDYRLISSTVSPESFEYALLDRMVLGDTIEYQFRIVSGERNLSGSSFIASSVLLLNGQVVGVGYGRSRMMFSDNATACTEMKRNIAKWLIKKPCQNSPVNDIFPCP